jgi:hypothetical protein
VLEEYQLLLVLSNKNLSSYPLETLDASDAQSALAKRPGRKIGHASFFRTGVCLGRHLVCCVKTSAPSSTIKVYEPMDSMVKGKKKPAFSKMFQGGQDTLKPFKVGLTITSIKVSYKETQHFAYLFPVRPNPSFSSSLASYVLSLSTDKNINLWGKKTGNICAFRGHVNPLPALEAVRRLRRRLRGGESRDAR